MKILISTKDYLPSLGGLQTMARALKVGFESEGHQVRIITETIENDVTDDGNIYRSLNLHNTLKLFLWADVVLLNHVSIRYAFWSILTNRPYVLSMSGWFGDNLWIRFVFQFIASQASANISACKAVQKENGVDSSIIPNPYNDQIFTNFGQEKTIDYLFAGRLISSKGVMELVEAWTRLLQKNFNKRLLIVGDGDLFHPIEETIKNHHLVNYIQLKHSISQYELVQLLNKVDFFIIPSAWNEPIGIVSLEAIACGAIPIGSDGGGLAESIGSCGLTFPRLNWKFLEQLIIQSSSMSDREKDFFRSQASSHLQKYMIPSVSKQYQQVLTNL